jgi:hypothetical protein
VSQQPECTLAFTLREAKVGNHVRRAGLEAAVDFDSRTSPLLEGHEVQSQQTWRRLQIGPTWIQQFMPISRRVGSPGALDALRPCRRYSGNFAVTGEIEPYRTKMSLLLNGHAQCWGSRF